MFDNDVKEVINNTESSIRLFSDEEAEEIQKDIVVSSPNSQPEEEFEIILTEEEEQRQQFSVSPFNNLKVEFEKVLTHRDWESAVVFLTDELLRQEQLAMNEDVKRDIRVKKYMLGKIMTECSTQGDQQQLLFMLASRLGYSSF